MNFLRRICMTALLFVLSTRDAAATDTGTTEARGKNPREDTLGLAAALSNARIANEGFRRCVRYVEAWTRMADPATGLIPRNLRESRDIWNAWDAGADNYPFMVLVSSLLMPRYFRTTAHAMLRTEKRLSSRIGRLPDNYSFSRQGFQYDATDTNRILFGSAEYMKDGLLPLTEWLGPSAWSERMLGILDDLPRIADRAIDVRGDWYGNSATVEVNGDLLQVLSRMYHFTGREEYLDRAVAMAEHYLTDDNLPTIALDRLRLRDHGCEIVSGLCEAYYTVRHARPELAVTWKANIHRMLDRILEVGRNADGLFYDEVDPKTGRVLSARIADNFGYTLDAYWTIGLLDTVPAYLAAVRKALSSLPARYRGFDWENGSADGFADAIEGALNLYNREAVPGVADWLDSETRILWSMQKPEGLIEGWHGDGNFARTTIMYCLWKTQGVHAARWDPDLHIGAIFSDTALRIAITSEKQWRGRLLFDTPRHRAHMRLPGDYPRINQFPEWFTVTNNRTYAVKDLRTGGVRHVPGRRLARGMRVRVAPGEVRYLELR
jgi:hypothetical protein